MLSNLKHIQQDFALNYLVLFWTRAWWWTWLAGWLAFETRNGFNKTCLLYMFHYMMYYIILHAIVKESNAQDHTWTIKAVFCLAWRQAWRQMYHVMACMQFWRQFTWLVFWITWHVSWRQFTCRECSFLWRKFPQN